MRLVAGDASVLMPAVRPCLLKRSAADPDQRLFALYLPKRGLKAPRYQKVSDGPPVPLSRHHRASSRGKVQEMPP